ncbi:helix-turn-helix transcriptional regulator, partial [Streptomyces sp. MBT59]|uniref:helix-turn-helix domain-containing protein n=1 Tax=Streptomyces sp. MBT59 TaxID=1488390 RepID=UPI001F2FCE9B
MSELFDAVDALVASRSALPPPAERKRLRQGHGLTLDEVAAALRVRRATVSGWEAGRTEPRPPERDAYARMLKQLSELYPADAPVPAEDTAVLREPAVGAGAGAGAGSSVVEPTEDTVASRAPAAAPPAVEPVRARAVPAGPAAEPGSTTPHPPAPARVSAGAVHPPAGVGPMSRRP